MPRFSAPGGPRRKVASLPVDPINLSLTLYAFVKVAWVAGMTILDYGSPEDVGRLKRLITTWPEHEQREFKAYVKDYRGFDKA